jgi:UDP-4-amino-4,6-dideoxy-N-acetyl-beta-L-altrosamine transaminase
LAGLIFAYSSFTLSNRRKAVTLMDTNTLLPYGRQSLSEADLQAVMDVLRSDFLTQGPVTPQFEQAVATYCQARHGVAVNSATAALHLACLALDLGPGDTLWTSPITFVASANCALYCGAQVDFVDIDPVSYNMCPLALEKKLQHAQASGTLPKIVVPVHLSGLPCDMAAIHALSIRYGFRIIEDASHAIGARYGQAPVGNCQYSDITVFSFHPVKIITTGEGGMAMTNDPDLAKRMARLRSHGITRDADEMTQESEGAWYYQQLELGFNYRLTEIQAALGLSQLQQLASFIERRRQLAQRYNALLADLPLQLPHTNDSTKSALHLYVVRLKLPAGKPSRKEVFAQLRDAGILVNVHYIPVYAQPFYTKYGYDRAAYPESEKYYQEAISLPLYPDLSFTQQDRVIAALAKAIQR